MMMMMYCLLVVFWFFSYSHMGHGAEEVAQATASVVSFLFFSILLSDTKKQKTYDRSGRLCDFFGARFVALLLSLILMPFVLVHLPALQHVCLSCSMNVPILTLASKALLLRDLQWAIMRIPPAFMPRCSTVGKHAYPTSYM